MKRNTHLYKYTLLNIEEANDDNATIVFSSFLGKSLLNQQLKRKCEPGMK